jgi:predicted GIY-YIG superfamily endonuclease
MTCGYIYKIQFPNGKHYIGLTTNSLDQRKQEHKCRAKRGDTKILYNALRKYDMVDTFELIEIDTAETLEELGEKEIGYILMYNSYYLNETGYNMTYGGEGNFGYVHTEENNIKNSERMKKYHKDNPNAGKENGEKIKKDYEDNPELRKQASERTKKYFENNPEAAQKMSELKKKYHEDNPEAAQKMSEIKKKYHEDNPEAAQKMSEIKKKYHEDNPEAAQKMSERMKQNYKPELIKKKLDTQGKNKPFDVFTADGTLIKTFNYKFEARKYLQKEHNIISTINICDVLSGRLKSSAGFVFKYK